MATILDKLVTVLAFDRDEEDLKKFDTAIKNTQRRMRGLSTGALALGGALTAAGGLVTRTILGYEQAFNELAATYLDAPADAIEQLRRQSLELGATTSKSASQVVAAQTALARSGLSVNDVLAATPDVLNLAIAGNLDMAQAAGIVTSQMAAFGLQAGETGRVTDVLAAAASSSRTSIAELGPTFRQVAPLAAALGVDIEQTAALLGTLRTGGLIPEQAGTALRNIIAILQEEPTPAIREAFDELGVSFDTIQEVAKRGDVITAMQMLNAAGLDAGSALEIFGREAATGAIILADAGVAVRNLDGQLRDASGTANEMRVIMESGLPGGIAEFKSAAEGLQLALGDSGLTGTVTGFLNKATRMLQWLREAPGWVKTLTTTMLIAGPAIIGVGLALRGVAFALGGFSVATTIATGLMTALRSGTLLLRIQLAALAVWQGIVTAAQWLWNVAMTANPIGLVIAGIAALVAGLVIAYKKSETFRNIVWAMWGALKKFWPFLLGPMGLAIKGFQLLWKHSDLFRAILEKIFGAASKVGGLIGKVLGVGGDGSGGGAIPTSTPAGGPGLVNSQLPVGPATAGLGGGGTGFGGGASISQTIENVNVQVTNGNPEEVRAATLDAMAESNRQLVEQVDTMIAA